MVEHSVTKQRSTLTPSSGHPSHTTDIYSHSTSMIILTPTRLHWIKDDGDDQSDLCAHSPVLFQIEDKILVAPSDGNVTVSAAAIYLLRTLERDHTKGKPVGEQLLPCCGHAL